MNNPWHQNLGMRWPVIQAPMGGNISTRELVVAVSKAGGLGMFGLVPEDHFASAIPRIREALGTLPFGVNLLMPVARKGHFQACLEHKPPVVSVFLGHDAGLLAELKAAGCFVLYQIGTLQDAEQVMRDGADGLIVQGTEAGGHVCGRLPLADILPTIAKAFPGIPLIAAGGIHDAASVRAAKALGANGVAAGTRFLLSHESNARDDYKQILLDSDTTILTNLFGLGWDAPHRVVPNAATDRWCDADGNARRWLSGFNRLMEKPGHLLPLKVAMGTVKSQRPGLPIFSPAAVSRGQPGLTSATALYAGKCIADIHHLMSAGEIVEELGNEFA